MMLTIAKLNELSSFFWSFFQKEILYSSILFLVVLALTQILKRKSLYLQYGLWTLVLLRLVLPPDLSLRFSARSFMEKVGIFNGEPISAYTSLSASDESLLSGSQPVSRAMPEQTQNADFRLSSVIERTSWLSQFSWPTVFFLFWLLGLLIFFSIFVRRYFHYWRVIKDSTIIADAKVLNILESWRLRFEIRRKIKILSSEKCLSPFTIGVFRPIIYLPETIVSKSDLATIESVIAHELAHVKSYDDFWIKLQNFIQIVYFFHPVVWFANSQLNQVRERICDELVLSHGIITPKAYGKSMLTVLKMNLLGPEGVEMLPSFGNHKKKFSLRINSILQITKIKKSNLLVMNMLILALALLLLPMAHSSSLNDSKAGAIKLKRMINGTGDFQFHTLAAGSQFMKFAASEAEGIFCESKLPSHLKDMEFAAIGIYDTEYRKIWVLKGVNTKRQLEIYVDSNGDNCFTDEKPLQTTKKTAKYNYEGSAEWSMTKYIKAPVTIDYRFGSGKHVTTRQFAAFLVYYPQDNFLEFANNEFWFGKAKFGDRTYPIALYGGIKNRWYLCPIFDQSSNQNTENEIRIDLNADKVFGAMTFFDPTHNSVIQEKYFVNETLMVNGGEFTINVLENNADEILLQINPVKAEEEISKLTR